MRRPVQFALVAVVVLLAGTATVLFVQYRKAAVQYTMLKATEESTRSRYAQTIDAIAEIQDSLNAISIGDTTVQLFAQNLETEQRLTGPDGRDALDRIAILRASIIRNKQRIRQLESSLEHSGNRVTGLQRMVAGLKRTVAEKEQLVAALTGRVDTLQTRVTGLVAEVQEKQEDLRARDQTIEERRRELATVYVAVGTRRDLTAAGVIVARGGLLGLGKTIQPSGAFSEAAFRPLDTDQETVIPISAAKAQVVSAQAPAGYELRLLGDKLEPRILDPREFRKVRQLVIVTA